MSSIMSVFCSQRIVARRSSWAEIQLVVEAEFEVRLEVRLEVEESPGVAQRVEMPVQTRGW